MKKTTPKQFEEFKAEVLRLQPILQLNDWQLYFKHGKLKDCFARTYYDTEGRVANIIFANEQDDDDFVNLDVKRTAKHELLHLFLAEVIDQAENRRFNQTDLNAAEEKIIRKLEKLIP